MNNNFWSQHQKESENNYARLLAYWQRPAADVIFGDKNFGPLIATPFRLTTKPVDYSTPAPQAPASYGYKPYVPPNPATGLRFQPELLHSPPEAIVADPVENNAWWRFRAWYGDHYGFIPGFTPKTEQYVQQHTPKYQVPPKSYQAQNGESLYSIAEANGLSYAELAAANPSITSVGQGQYINIPPGRIDMLKNVFQSASDPSQLPQSIPSSDITQAGYTPAQMAQAGYTLQGGNWVMQSYASGPVTANNWMTNPALHQVTFNRNAKNKHSRFATNEKWAANAYRRKKRAAKGIGQRTEPGTPLRGDTPSTTLDLILGS